MTVQEFEAKYPEIITTYVINDVIEDGVENGEIEVEWYPDKNSIEGAFFEITPIGISATLYINGYSNLFEDLEEIAGEDGFVFINL